MVFSVLGLDIGGANLKAAHSSGVARLQPFELWKRPAELPQALGKLLQAMPDFDLLANTLRTMLRTGRFEVTELYQARLLLEPGVAEIAARVADDDDIALLRASLEEGRHLLARKAQTAPASYNFHFLLAKAAKSNLMLMLISSLMDLVHKSDQVSGPRPQLSPPIVRAHEAIVNAIERHDADEARRLTTEHLFEIQQRVTQRIERLAS